MLILMLIALLILSNEQQLMPDKVDAPFKASVGSVALSTGEMKIHLSKPLALVVEERDSKDAKKPETPIFEESSWIAVEIKQSEHLAVD